MAGSLFCISVLARDLDGVGMAEKRKYNESCYFERNMVAGHIRRQIYRLHEKLDPEIEFFVYRYRKEFQCVIPEFESRGRRKQQPFVDWVDWRGEVTPSLRAQECLATLRALIINTRHAKGWTQSEVAGKCGLTRRTYNKMERGKHLLIAGSLWQVLKTMELI